MSGLKLRYGTHLPVLIRLVSMTTGPILELGCGLFSTPFLHWACFPNKRRLVTYENDKSFYEEFKKWDSAFHQVALVEDWDTVDLSEPWSVVLVDHRPGFRRSVDMKRLLHADYIVAHDTQSRSDHHYGYAGVFELFKYHYKYKKVYPYTSILSNRFNTRRIMR